MRTPSELRIDAALAAQETTVAPSGGEGLPVARAMAAGLLAAVIFLLITTPPLVAAGGLSERFSTQLQPQVPDWLGTLAQLVNVARLAAALTITGLLAGSLGRKE